MKKNKSLLPLIAFALIFASVISCDDQDEKKISGKLGTKNGSVSGDISGGRVEANFDGSEGDPIALETALRWTENYRATLQNSDEHRGHYFGFQIIEQLLQESSCVGIRIYYGLDDEGKKQLLIVGVNAEGEDLIPSPGGRVNDGGIVIDASLPCPSYCSSGGL